MCGIAAIRRYGDTPIKVEQITTFLCGMEHRGNDATGVALQNDKGQIFVVKQDEPAWQFTCSKRYENFIKDHLDDSIVQVLMHTRAATQGNPRIEKNNHPLVDKQAVIIHNGNIYNDDWLFKELKLNRHAETDSDIIRAIVDEHGITKKAIDVLNRMSGAAAIACLHPEYPGRMLIGRSGSPLVLATTDDPRTGRFAVWASEKSIIHAAMRPWCNRWGIDAQYLSLDIAFAPMADDTLWLMGPEGKEWHGRFTTLHGRYTEPNRQTYDKYTERQTKWGSKSGSVPFPKSVPLLTTGSNVKCPACGLSIFIAENQKHVPLSKLFCPRDHNGCGSPLALPSKEYPENSKLN